LLLLLLFLLVCCKQAPLHSDAPAHHCLFAAAAVSCWLQLLFLVRRFDDAGLLLLCEEWCEVLPGNLPMWLMVKNYLLQYILLEATYLRSSCCITGEAAGVHMLRLQAASTRNRQLHACKFRVSCKGRGYEM
jgi:hypothetical protein